MGRANSTEPRAWQRMLSGRRLDLLNPSPVDIEIEDIAHGLARVARWNGQTHGEWAFSVAQHSIVVLDVMNTLSDHLPVKWQMAGLLHDASEYVVGDMISPFKNAIGYDYKAFEERLQNAILIRFGLPTTIPKTTRKLIKKADTTSAYFEAIQIAGFSKNEAVKIWGKPRVECDIDCTPCSPETAKAAFLERFEDLLKRLDQS